MQHTPQMSMSPESLYAKCKMMSFKKFLHFCKMQCIFLHRRVCWGAWVFSWDSANAAASWDRKQGIQGMVLSLDFPPVQKSRIRYWFQPLWGCETRGWLQVGPLLLYENLKSHLCLDFFEATKDLGKLLDLKLTADCPCCSGSNGQTL